MKDNEKNLNNALSDDEMEAVAGGGNWGYFQKRKFKKFAKENLTYSDYGIEDYFKNYTPETTLAEALSEHSDLTKEQVAELRKILS